MILNSTSGYASLSASTINTWGSGSTLNINSSTILPYTSTIAIGTGTIGNTILNNPSYVYSTGSWVNFETNDYTDLALNLEKLGLMETTTKELVLTLFDTLCSSNTSSNEKKLIFNTIDSYHLFVDTKSLKRKNKIQSTLKQ